MGNIAQVPAQPGAADAVAMGMRYGPNAGLALQRSQYLAQALQAMQANAQNNIRTPGALWANLAADALLQHGKNKADQQAMQAYQSDRQSLIDAAKAGTPLAAGFMDPATLPQTDPNAPRDPGMSVPPQGPTPPNATADAIAPQAAVDPKLLHLAQMVYGEARGEPAQGQQAVAAVALNRAKASGKDLDAVLAAPHQFSGYNPQTQGLTPDQLGPVMGNISGVYNGTTPDPTGGADHFFAPALASPSWGQGAGQTIGGHKFMTLGDQGHAAAPPPQAGPQAAPPAQPYQIASNGQTPPPPSPGAGPATAPAPAAGLPAGAGAQPQGAPLPTPGPRQVVTPEEWSVAASLLQDPRTMDQGLAMIQQLKMKAASLPEDPSKPYWGPDGQAHYAPGTQSTVTAGALPGSYWVRSPQGDLKNVNEPNLNNAPPSGYDRDPRNPNHLILQGTGGGPAAASGAQAPAGKAPIPPALQDTYMKTIDAWHKAPGYTDYANSVNAANALEANLRAAAGNNGVVSQATTDNLIRAMTGLSARQGSVTSMLDHLPWSDQLKGFIAKAVGPEGMNGFVTPKVLQQMRTAVHAYADGHRQLAEDEYKQFNSGANRMGFDLGESLPTIQDAGPIKWLDDAAAPAPAPNAGALAAAQAEIARRKAAGTWRGH